MPPRTRSDHIYSCLYTAIPLSFLTTFFTCVLSYSIIQKDTNIRFDYALRLANELDVDVNEICSASPFSGELTEDEIYPTVKDTKGILDANRVKSYLKYSLLPLMELYGKNSMPDVDNLLTSFYQLDDEARHEVIDTIKVKLQYHKDSKRAEDIKNIKGW